jgi:hypothetical protein
MTTTYLTAKDPAAQPAIRLMRAAFPGYTGRLFHLRVQDTVNVRSYWDGGSRDYFRFVSLDDGRTSAEIPVQSPYDRPIPGAESVPLPAGVACVEHAIVQGKDRGLTLIIGPANAPHWLPPGGDLLEAHAIVLSATASLKNTYGGETDIRFRRAHEITGITRAIWDQAVADVTAAKYLAVNGAITPNGRNAVANHPLRYRIN